MEEIATTFANRMIVTCPTPFERMQLCKLLAEIDFGQQFSCQGNELVGMLFKFNMYPPAMNVW